MENILYQSGLYDFPTEYTVKPGISKLGDEKFFIIDDLLPLYKNEKQDARADDLSEYYLERTESKSQGFTEIQKATQKHLMKNTCFWMAEQLSKEYKHIHFFSEDDYYVFDNELTNETVYLDEDLKVLQVVKSPLCLCSKQCGGCKYPTPNYVNLFDAICSQIQEDVCIMQHDNLVAAHACLPSWWTPKEKMMKGMADIHCDVPGMNKTAYEQIWNACLNKGPYIRHNWTLTSSPILNQHPSKNIGKDFNKGELFLRIERQVLRGFAPTHSVLFLIRTFVAPIKTLDKSQRETLVKVVDNMSAEEISYKGLDKDKIIPYII